MDAPVVPTSRRGGEKWGTPKFVGVDDTDTLAMTAGRLRKDVRKSLVLSLKLVAGTKMGCPMSRAVCETWEAADPGHPPGRLHGRVPPPGRQPLRIIFPDRNPVGRVPHVSPVLRDMGVTNVEI